MNATSPSYAPSKSTWFVLWAAFTAAPVIYFVVGMQVAGSVRPSAALPTLRIAFAALALVTLAAGTFLLTRTARARPGALGAATFFGGEQLAPPVAFQQAFVVATALVEACSIYGFVLLFLGAPALEYLPFGAGTMGVMIGLALPVGLRYWSEREQADASGVPPIQ